MKYSNVAEGWSHLVFKKLVFFISIGMLISQCNIRKDNPYPHVELVNTLIGTAPLLDTGIIGYTPPDHWRVWAGLTFPGSSLPNAMVQLSPITEFGSGAGYEYEDSIIYGFAHTNKGHWNLCNIPVLPVTGKYNEHGFKSGFDHDSEIAKPGYYRVILDDYQIDVELTSTLRCGYHRYKFQQGDEKQVSFHLSRSNERVKHWDLNQVGKYSVSGYQETGQRIYFYANFSEPISEIGQINNARSEHNVVHFIESENQELEMKIGLSFVSEANAKENLEREIGNLTFDEVLDKSQSIWEEHLSKIEIEGGTQKQREMFYTSLYRAFLWPALRSDINGEYLDVNGNTIKADYNYYTIPSFWDTYRNKLVLLGILSPQVTSDVIKTLIDIGEKHGFIPTFFHGDHAAVFIAGSYLRGIDDFDVEKAYQLLVKNATVEGGTRPHILEYMDKGYISTPEIGDPHVETKAKAGVTKTLEYAYDDYAVALLANSLNDTDNYQLFMQRAQNYRNVFDSSSGFMRGRLAEGRWVTNFDPQYPYYEYMYREANAWQSTFFAPHDVSGLIELYGGNENFEKKLDSLFAIPWNPNDIARNVSGFIGQYCHGNQPDHNYPYLYYHVEKQEKTQYFLDSIMNYYYGIGDEGLALCGMDDAGEMSSWYVFSAMGIYPFSPADPEYLISIPLFDKVIFHISDHEMLEIYNKTRGKKITNVTLNGSKIRNLKISHDQLMMGGELILE